MNARKLNPNKVFIPQQQLQDLPTALLQSFRDQHKFVQTVVGGIESAERQQTELSSVFSQLQLALQSKKSYFLYEVSCFELILDRVRLGLQQPQLNPICLLKILGLFTLKTVKPAQAARTAGLVQELLGAAAAKENHLVTKHLLAVTVQVLQPVLCALPQTLFLVPIVAVLQKPPLQSSNGLLLTYTCLRLVEQLVRCYNPGTGQPTRPETSSPIENSSLIQGLF